MISTKVSQASTGFSSFKYIYIYIYIYSPFVQTQTLLAPFYFKRICICTYSSSSQAPSPSLRPNSNCIMLYNTVNDCVFGAPIFMTSSIDEILLDVYAIWYLLQNADLSSSKFVSFFHEVMYESDISW